jgi:hypothetical protein
MDTKTIETSIVLFTVLNLIFCTVLFPIIRRAGLLNKRNAFIGYRTSRSLQSDQIWQKAQEICESYWLKYFVYATLISIALAFLWFNEILSGHWVIISSLLLQAATLILIVVKTESKLKRDINGV